MISVESIFKEKLKELEFRKRRRLWVRTNDFVIQALNLQASAWSPSKSKKTYYLNVGISIFSLQGVLKSPLDISFPGDFDVYCRIDRLLRKPEMVAESNGYLLCLDEYSEIPDDQRANEISIIISESMHALDLLSSESSIVETYINEQLPRHIFGTNESRIMKYLLPLLNS